MPGPAFSVRLELPFPPKELSPNARVHWRTKAKVVADYREACGWEAYGARPGWKLLPPLTPPVRASVTFVVPDRRKRDLDNLLSSIKPLWDGLVDAGVLAGDDSERFKVESTEVVVLSAEARQNRGYATPAIQPCVIVELRSL